MGTRTWKPYRYPVPDSRGHSFPMGVHHMEYLITLDLYDYCCLLSFLSKIYGRFGPCRLSALTPSYTWGSMEWRHGCLMIGYRVLHNLILAHTCVMSVARLLIQVERIVVVVIVSATTTTTTTTTTTYSRRGRLVRRHTAAFRFFEHAWVRPKKIKRQHKLCPWNKNWWGTERGWPLILKRISRVAVSNPSWFPRSSKPIILGFF